MVGDLENIMPEYVYGASYSGGGCAVELLGDV